MTNAMTISNEMMAWVVIPVLIFVARLIDMTLATMRHILITRGAKRIVPLLAFVEVTVWLLAMTQIMSNLDNLAYSLAWAAGFAAGTYCGMALEEKLALGHQLVRIFCHRNPDELARLLRERHYAATVVAGNGGRGRVEVVLVAVARSKVRGLMTVLRNFDPSLFVTLEDLRTVQAGVFPVGKLPGVTESISEAPGESLSLPPQGKTDPAPDDGACLPVIASACCGGQPGVRK